MSFGDDTLDPSNVNPLSSLTQEQLDRLFKILGKRTTVQAPVKVVQLDEYWHVYCGAFDTVVPKRDAPTKDSALNVAIQPLQRWYIRKNSFIETPTVEPMTHNEWCDWVKQ